MAKTFDEVVYSLCKKYTDQSQLGFKSVKQVANGFEIEYVNGTKATYTVQNMHQHTNMAILNVLNKDADGDLTFNGKKITNLTADQEQLLMKFSLSADNKLLFDGMPIEGGGSGEPYDDTEVRGLIDTNKTDISDLTTKIGTTAMGTTATDVTGAVAEVNGNQLDTVSFSADYKNIVLNRKNGTNPYTIPIATIINHAKLVELADVDATGIGNGKTLVYDAAAQKHKYVSSSGTDELVKMDAATDAHYLTDLLDKQTVVNNNGVLKVKKLDGQEVTIAEINYLKGLTMNVMDLVNAFANGGVKVLNTPVATHADLATLDRSTFIDGISYIVYVLADETHAGAKTTYLCNKTSETYFGNADSQRNFTTDPIDLASEVTGKLGTSNIDVDSLWNLLTINDTYKTLTAKDEVFGTHGAKKLYDELTTEIGKKANNTDLATHIGDIGIHVTTTERTKWNEVVNKANKTEVLLADNVLTTAGNETHDNVYSAKLTKTELDKKANDTDLIVHTGDTDIHTSATEKASYVKKTDISTTIDSTSTDDTVPTTKAVNELNIRGTLIDQSVIDKYGTEIIKYPLGRWYFDRSKVARQFSDIPWREACIIEITSIINQGNPWDNTWSYRNYKAQAITNQGTFVRQLESRDTAGVLFDTGWQRVCTTSVADVGKTDVASRFSNVTVNVGGGAFYSVKNGVCYFQIRSVTTTAASSAKTILSAGTLPTPDMNLTNGHYVVTSSDAINGLLVISVDGSAVYHGSAMTIFTSFSYPVAE